MLRKIGTVLLLNITYLVVDAFSVPKTDFLLDIDGNSVGTGMRHVCAISQKHGEEIGGKVQCWGHDQYNGALSPPVEINFIQVVSGYGFSCGVSVDQNVYCWGKIKGQIPGLYNQISAPSNGNFACGVMTNGKINCWGNSMVTRHTPTDEQLKFAQVSCSYYHCCAVDINAYPHCWGNDMDESKPPSVSLSTYKKLKSEGTAELSKKEIGMEEEEMDEDLEQAPDKEDNVLSKVQFRQVSAGDGITCGITLLGSHLRCWGTDHDQWGKFPMVLDGPFRQVSVGGDGVCAISAEKTASMIEGESDSDEKENATQRLERPADRLYCWGHASAMVQNELFEAWDQISVGNGNICGVSMDSELECWGSILPAHARDFHKTIIVA